MDSQIPTVKKWKYDVFLNFRRQDLEGNFVTQLYKRLEDMGINVFKPDFEYERKEEPITTEISEAIEESMIAITIFSEYYASSRQRLEELSKIMEWVDNQGQEFFSVFYRVTASQVSGIIDQTLAQYIADDIIYSYTVELQRWTDAFSKAFNIAGFKRDSFPLELIRCKRLADMWALQGWNINFRRQINDWEVQRGADFFSTLEQLSGLQIGEDVPRWPDNTKGLFKANATSKLMNQSNHLAMETTLED
ncbi:hypothetical protein CQW23_14840 [Capsicum baccatum]|uniref:TIR domain-containing protein n=1 Tax=Capsicum baccatum TaxID=33114 RepID=A0A2G2WKD7_CAPBA|nr:hypothetical protein CQW23_14840 [Capsicum baccatum]